MEVSVRPISDRPSPALSIPPAGPKVSLLIQSDDPRDLAEITRDVVQRSPGNRVTADLPLIGAVAVEVAPEQASGLLSGEAGGLLADRPAVRIYPDAPVRLIEPIEEEISPLVDTAAPTLGAPELWKRGIDGKGIAVAVIDTGIAPHPDVRDRIIGFQDMVNGKTEPYDDQGHGTHVAGTVAGDGTSSDGAYKGIAPGASLVGVKVLNGSGRGNTSDILRGIQWAVENRERFNIRVINMSLGGATRESWKDDPLAQAVEAATAKGIVCAIAAGNSGPRSRTIGTPANAPSVVSVGASDDRGTPTRRDDGIADFSSRGPTAVDGLAKPDLAAPGVKITAADNRSNGYRTLSGTSMATPATAGVMALLLQAHPDATPAEVKAALVETAERMPQGGGPQDQGRGLVDAVKAEARLAKA